MKIEITVKDGVVEIEKAPDNVEIIVTDLDSKEQDYYQGTNMWQRLDLSDVCEQCKKLGENTCGNDINHQCFEPKN